MNRAMFQKLKFGAEKVEADLPTLPNFVNEPALSLGGPELLVRDVAGDASATSKIAEERFNLTPEVPVKNVVKGLQVLDYALAVESVVRATQVGEGGSVLVQELTRAAVSGGSVVAANAGAGSDALAS